MFSFLCEGVIIDAAIREVELATVAVFRFR